MTRTGISVVIVVHAIFNGKRLVATIGQRSVVGFNAGADVAHGLRRKQEGTHQQ
jgi:hypothetical protein